MKRKCFIVLFFCVGCNTVNNNEKGLTTEYTIDKVKDTETTYVDSETSKELTEPDSEEIKSNNDKKVGYSEYVNSFEDEYESCPFLVGGQNGVIIKKPELSIITPEGVENILLQIFGMAFA